MEVNGDIKGKIIVVGWHTIVSGFSALLREAQAKYVSLLLIRELQSKSFLLFSRLCCPAQLSCLTNGQHIISCPTRDIISENFIDPDTGAHTQTSESFWDNFKAVFKSMPGSAPEQLPGYLWKKIALSGVNQ